MGPVLNLNLSAEGSDFIAVTWEVPANSSACILTYLLEFSVGGESHIAVTDDTIYRIDYTPCNNVQLRITAHTSTGREGVAALGNYVPST